MKLIIAGGRSFTDLEFMRETMTLFPDVTEIVCGMARGADLAGRRWAHENGIAVAEFPADWDQYGRRAGFIRNGDMARYADGAVVFWDGQSRGSKHMIDIMKAEEKPVTVVMYGDSE